MFDYNNQDSNLSSQHHLHHQQPSQLPQLHHHHPHPHHSSHHNQVTDSQPIVPFMIETSDPTSTIVQSTSSVSAYDYWSRESTAFDRKDLADDAKSNRSAMTNKSTRQVFDFMAKALPIGVFLLLVSLMVHFVSNVEALEPIRSISRLVCIVLAMTVIPLSVVFIMKTICDRKDNSCWHCTEEYDTDYLSPIRYFDSNGRGSVAQASYKVGAPNEHDSLEEYYQMKEIPLR